MYIRVKSLGRMQGITAIVMAYAVMLILVSPLVPSPLTTMRSKQTVQPPHFVAPVSALLFTAVVDTTRTFWLMEEPERLHTRGSDVVDLTTARLC
jgi:choline-glycine betaine transporter